MKKFFSPILFCFAITCLLFTSCEKEQINTSEFVPIDKKEAARNYLDRSATMLTFAVLEMDHDSYEIRGFVVDKNSNVRLLNMIEASYLGLETTEMSTYFTDRMYEKSQATKEVDIEEHAYNVKASRALKTHESYTTNENTNTSKIFFAFKPTTHIAEHGNCAEGNNSESSVIVLNKVILAASGKFNYEPTLEGEKNIVAWLQSFETEKSN